MDNQAHEILSKTSYEERYYQFDWTDRLDTGETMSNPGCAVTPTGPTLGTPTITGSTVILKLTGGTINTTYQITCKVDTSTGQKLEGTGLLKVVPPGELS